MLCSLLVMGALTGWGQTGDGKQDATRRPILAPLHVLSAHESHAYSAVFSPDSRLLATCGRDRTVKVWDCKTGALAHTLSQHPGRVEALAFSADGRYLASGGEYNTVIVWSTDTWTALKVFKVKGRTTVSCAAFSPNGRLVAAGTEDKAITVWERDSGIEIARLKGHPSGVAAVQFNSDSIVRAQTGDWVWDWDLSTKKQMNALACPDTEATAALMSPDGKTWATSNFYLYNEPFSRLATNGAMKIWDGATRRITTSFRYGIWEIPYAFSADGKLLLVRTHGALGTDFFDGLLTVWETETGKLRAVLIAPAVTSAAFSPDNSLIAAAGEDGTVKIWRL